MPASRKDPMGNYLPKRLHYKAGGYYYVYRNKWTLLSRDYGMAMKEYAAQLAPAGDFLKLSSKVYQTYQKRHETGDLAKQTYAGYRAVRERIEVAFGKMAIANIKPAHIGQFLDFYFEEKQGMGNIARNVLNTIFARAVRYGLAEYNPVKEVPRFKCKPRDRHITDAEWDAIYHAAPVYLRQVMGMCYLTAQRIGDVLSIRQTDISDDGIEFQQQKTKNRILVESSPALRELVREIRGSKVVGVHLFQVGYDRVSEAWRQACKKAGVEDARIHDIRAKALTDADALGMDAQKLAGHSSPDMTRRYLRLRRTEKVTGVQTLEVSKKNASQAK